MSIDYKELTEKSLQELKDGKSVKFGFFVESDLPDEELIAKASQITENFSNTWGIPVEMVGVPEIQRSLSIPRPYASIKWWIEHPKREPPSELA